MLCTAWKPLLGAWLQSQRPLPPRGHFLVYWGIWSEFILIIGIMSRPKAEKPAELEVPEGFGGRQDTVRVPPRGSPLCRPGREVITVRPAARSIMAPDTLEHGSRQGSAGDAAHTAARFTRKHGRDLQGQPSPARCPLPQSCWAPITHQSGTSDPRVSTQTLGDMWDHTMGQTKPLLETPHTNTGNSSTYQHPQSTAMGSPAPAPPKAA